MAIGYKLYRNSGGSTAISGTADTTCQMETNPAPQYCTISGLTNGDVYKIQLATINEVGEAPLSSIAELTSAATPAQPNAPTVVSVDVTDPANPSRLRFSWFRCRFLRWSPNANALLPRSVVR